MPEVVHLHPGDSRGRLSLAPPVSDRVLMRRITRQALEQSACRVGARPVLLNVPREQLHEEIGQVHHALAAVLRWPDVDAAALVPLHLPRDCQRAAQEVNIIDLQGAATERTAPVTLLSPLSSGSAVVAHRDANGAVTRGFSCMWRACWRESARICPMRSRSLFGP